jgi:hypothetical protein
MKQIVIDTAQHVGTGVTGIAGVSGVDTLGAGDTVSLVLKLVIAIVTIAKPLQSIALGIASLFKRKAA